MADASGLFDLSGKVALVTGGSRGLGRAMVLAFAQAGADVIIASRKLASCEATADEVRKATGRLDVNLKGPFRLTAMVGARMAAGAGGSIIMVSSTSAIRPTANVIPYAAAKAAVNALTEGFARAFGPTVRVNCIMPGPFLTDISKAWDLEAFRERAKTTMALGRGGEPEEVVGAALYFASSASSFTTGAVLGIHGGAA
jgi:NAD(P)-dependent dehydrogenase (short-subunit alcohol dehydrogenase family)